MASGRGSNGDGGHDGGGREHASSRRVRVHVRGAEASRLKEALDPIAAHLPERVRAHPIAAVALSVGSLALLGLALRFKAGRLLVMLVGGLALQQFLLIRAGVGLRSRPVEP